MQLWPALTAVVLGMSLPPVLRRLFPRRGRAPVDRAALLSTAGVLTPVATALWAGGGVPLATVALVPLGAFAGALVATARTTGLLEQDLAPPAAIREKVLAYHADAGFRCRPEPAVKRSFDLVAATVTLLVTLPLWPVIALLVWLEEPGPVLFVKHSVGRAGHTFRQVKFRSMRYGAERLTGPVASPAGDPRTLRVGRWLRRWHVDELTELVNVLSGAMSLVGPRPLRTLPVQRYLEEVPGYAERHSVRPGIACIAQIQRCHHSPHARLRKDRVYIRHMCLGLDVKLLWWAIVTTVRGQRDSGPAPRAAATLQDPGVGPATGSR